MADIKEDLYFLIKYYLELNGSDSDDFEIFDNGQINLNWNVKNISRPTIQQLRNLRNETFQNWKENNRKEDVIKKIDPWKIKLISEIIDLVCELTEKAQLSVEEKKVLYKKIFS